jgi:hypothetical protein
MFIHELLNKKHRSGSPEVNQKFAERTARIELTLAGNRLVQSTAEIPAMIRRNNRRKDQSERTIEKLGPNENPTQPLQQLVRNYFSKTLSTS